MHVHAHAPVASHGWQLCNIDSFIDCSSLTLRIDLAGHIVDQSAEILGTWSPLSSGVFWSGESVLALEAMVGEHAVRRDTRALVQVRCEESFRKLGLASDLDGVIEDLFNLIGAEPVDLALPRRHDFATLTGAVPHTPRTATLHSLAMSGWLHLRSQPLDACHPVPARGALPKHAPARPRDNGLLQDRPL